MHRSMANPGPGFPGGGKQKFDLIFNDFEKKKEKKRSSEKKKRGLEPFFFICVYVCVCVCDY